MQQFLRGETVTIEDEFYVDGTLTTPDTSCTVEIDDPVGTNVVNNQAMTEVSTGVLRYNYTIDSAANPGRYIADCIYTHSGVVTKERHYFQVVKEID